MKQIVESGNAPQAIGPYSQAVIYNGIAYCSGQIPLDPATGQVVDGGIEEQTERVMKNLEAVLAAAGSSCRQVLKTTVFLADMAEFPKMNEVYGRYFPEAPPARATVQAAGLPRGVRVEIECIAAVTA
ncbi:MAG: RidA family protein [Bryobacterales bacterium]|nr:RidA family protein [Bryobacterales bacterium]